MKFANKVKLNTTIALLFLASILFMYKLKTRLGINIFNGPHTPNLVEHWTGGLIKAEWIDFNYIRRP
jgi:hypothetical protein